MSETPAAPEYPSIARRIERVRTAPHGQKSRRIARLVKARTASLKREIAALRATPDRGKGR